MKKVNFFSTRLGLVAACSLMACSGAQAAITCSISSNGFSSAYVPTNAGMNITSASFTMTCTRGVSGDATSQAFTVMVDKGLNPAGQQKRGASGANFINYGTYTDGACATSWSRNVTLGGTVIMAADFLPHSQTISYWGCIPAGQTTAPAGTYTDTVTMTPTPGLPATFPVSIVTPSSCSIAASVGDLTFNYSAFQAAPALPSLPFTANCTNLLPYSMALDATSGTSLGLNYSLSLSATSGVGTGTAQNYTINGFMAAGQSGTCATGSCTTITPRTLTISY